MLNDAQIQALEDAQVSRFVDDRFGGLDLSGCPSLRETEPEPEFLDEDRHGLSRIDSRGSGFASAGLKKFLKQPDQAALEEIAPHNPGAAEEIETRRQLAEVQRFMETHPAYHRSEQNYNEMMTWLQEHKLSFTAENLGRSYVALSRSGELEQKPDEIRRLSESDRLAIARQAASGDVAGAIGNYIVARLPRDVAEQYVNTDSYQAAQEVLADPQCRDLLNEAALFVWGHSREDFNPAEDADFLNYVKAASKSKPLTTPYIQSLFERWQVGRRDQRREQLLGFGQANTAENAQEPPDLDSLDDATIERLRQATLREHAKQRQQRRA